MSRDPAGSPLRLGDAAGSPLRLGDAAGSPLRLGNPASLAAPAPPTVAQLVAYLGLGVLFGVILIKSEVVSWFRIQEMFRFQGFHMYGVMGTALLVAAPAVALIQRAGLRSATGEPIRLPPKALGRGTRYVAGGASFGVGWALVGACPGPMFALIGGGAEVILVALASALVGAWTYGALRPRLPH